MWHPILVAEERTPAVWTLVDGLARDYATIELRRTPDGPRYRVEYRGELIGWAVSLRVACERAHRAFLSDHGPAPFPGYPAYIAK
ncbi:hypothetical protein ACIGCK_04690 [Microbacterium sp. NPDC078428]|uniref:hypothetical protein n=1 Tax=Microbacterium sp. NPDC078428 TaxID=3364190 RepID=UPI0037CB16E2